MEKDRRKRAIAFFPSKKSIVRGEVLSFRYKTLPLWLEDARAYVHAHAVPAYGLLPAVAHLTDELLLQAIDEMIQYYGDDEDHLRDELLCFKVLLQRAKRLPEVELNTVLRRVRMFDPLLEQDPWVQEFGDRKKGEGKLEGELEALRNILVRIVRKRFPSLTETAEVRALQIEKPDMLDELTEQIALASNEQAARNMLEGRAS